jgi:CubicO group peptidase (beta-lactamase class C family)
MNQNAYQQKVDAKVNTFFVRKKNLYFTFFFAAVALLLAVWSWYASPETVFRIIRYNTSGIDDYKIFPSRPLRASQTPFHFVHASDESRIPQRITFGEVKGIPFDEFLKSNETVAFLVIKNDTVLFERYYDGYSPSSPSFSFSMAKSFLSILIGCAIDDRYIQSVDQRVTDFVPELAENGFGHVTIKHLLQMTSGMDYVESDNPFGIHPRFYYTTNLNREILKLRVRENPGQTFSYKSGENALLALILTRALRTMSITDYMQRRIWEPLGLEYNGAWSIDREDDGLEKTWCCLSATAKDFAKLGRLYLNKGNWNGKQIVSKSWVEQSTRLGTSDGSTWDYQYQWWLVLRECSDFAAVGHLGQYLYISPEKRVIIVRLGRSRGSHDHKKWMKFLTFLVNEVK